MCFYKFKQVKVTSSGSLGEAFSGRTSSGTFTDRTSPRCEARVVLAYHRMAHYVLIRCYLQPSLAEALCFCNFFSLRYRPHGLRRAIWKRIRLSPHSALRAYTVFLTAARSPTFLDNVICLLTLLYVLTERAVCTIRFYPKINIFFAYYDIN